MVSGQPSDAKILGCIYNRVNLMQKKKKVVP